MSANAALVDLDFDLVKDDGCVLCWTTRTSQNVADRETKTPG